ncbi:2-keto-3-deoxy-galactonokinase [Rhodobacterales bacterium HKCCE3408]|nr:2-keto-3-deoxy-galactonokinase [Rhodobacterales bacterium HKCCE3408]
MSRADWIAVDWGTTRLRAWAMDADGSVRDEASSGDGMGGLSRAGFEPALLRLIEPWLSGGTVPVLACGMVGSRQGWHEVPYVSIPAKPAELRPVPVPGTDRRIALAIIPGLSQAEPADVMRGEETQIAGFLSEAPDFDGVLCLPGTHTKWARISAGEVVGFMTAMTGEIYRLISDHSVIRHCLAGDGIADPAAFTDAVSDTLSRPEGLAQRLFAIRAETVLRDLGPGTARERLSGLLIGAELAAARGYWLGQDVAIAGAPGLAAAYGAALEAQGLAPRVLDADPLTRKGLAAAYLSMGQTAS